MTTTQNHLQHLRPYNINMIPWFLVPRMIHANEMKLGHASKHSQPRTQTNARHKQDSSTEYDSTYIVVEMWRCTPSIAERCVTSRTSGHSSTLCKQTEERACCHLDRLAKRWKEASMQRDKKEYRSYSSYTRTPAPFPARRG